jgi:hypothetical protein
MKNAIRAGGVYFAIVFACAFAVGTVRVLLVAPRTGATAAVILEAPILLAISWFTSRWCVRRWAAPNTLIDRMVMGATGFALLVVVEAGVAALVFHRPLHDQIITLGSPAGMIGLAAQIGFALMPLAGLLMDGALRRP